MINDILKIASKFEVIAKKKKDKKWIQKAIKRPGRFTDPSTGKSRSLKWMIKKYKILKNKKDKTKAERSDMGALAMAIRFKGGDVPGGEKKKGLKGTKS